MRPELVSRLVLIGPTKEMDETLVRRFRRAHPERAAEAGEEWALALRSLHPPERWKLLMEALGDGTANHPDWSDEELALLRCPVLVIYGDRDYYGAATKQPQRLAAAITNSRVCVLEGPHAIHRSDQGGRPDAVGDAVTAFLRQI
jgi:pimeloyl-ACP methyl ester carboxylesterase